MAIYDVQPDSTDQQKHVRVIPETFKEKLWMTWMLWRYPKRTGFYVRISAEWFNKNCKPVLDDSPNDEERP